MNVEVQAVLFPYDGTRTTEVMKQFESTLEAGGVRCVVGNMAISCYGEMAAVLSAISAAYQDIAAGTKCSVSLIITNDMPQIGRKPGNP
ncbi:MAG TPA: hypothetical protein PLO19_04190 [Candidatus Cryosericum sp.]|nr:hypothetical protein [Candidatus Cryosericum sp.]HPS69928.1 hypothetical protein [Candidatus Cryosericum sp.]